MDTEILAPASTIFGRTGLAIHFEEGLIGCEDWKRFVLDTVPEAAPLMLLRSLDEPEVSFIVGDPRSVLADYKLQPAESDLEALNCLSQKDLAALVIFNTGLEATLGKVTVNLLGPVAINLTSGAAKQIIQPEYSAHHPL